MRRLLILLAVIAAVPCGATLPCPPPPSSNHMFIMYTGSVSGCTSFGGAVCYFGEQITFEAKAFAYTFCAAQLFTWNLGDGSPLATGRKVIHAYADYGVREIELTLTTPGSPVIRLRTMLESGPHPEPPPQPPKRSRAVRH